MNVAERNFSYMLEIVNETLHTYKSTLDSEVGFTELSEKLKNYSSTFNQLLQAKQELKIPFASAKDQRWRAFAEEVIQLSAIIYQIALKKGDANMKLYARVSMSDLTTGAVKPRMSKIRSILDYAEEWEIEVLEYTNGEAILTSVISTFNEFEENDMLPFLRVSKRKNVNDSLKKLISEIRSFLREELDMLMRIFSNRAPAFYREYLSARKGKNLRGAYRTDIPPSEDSTNNEDSPDPEDNNASPPEDEGDIV